MINLLIKLCILCALVEVLRPRLPVQNHFHSPRQIPFASPTTRMTLHNVSRKHIFFSVWILLLPIPTCGAPPAVTVFGLGRALGVRLGLLVTVTFTD